MNIAIKQRATQQTLSERGATFVSRAELLDFDAEVTDPIFAIPEEAFARAKQFAVEGGRVWTNEIPLGDNYDPNTCLWELADGG